MIRLMAKEDVSWMRKSWLRYATWEMDVGLTIISHLKFRQDNIGHQKSSLEQTITLQLMFGPLPVQFLKW